MNENEKRFFEEATKAGFIVLKRGYPDFLVTHDRSKRICLVEVKTKGTKPSPEQEKMIQILRKAGIPVVVSPGNFTTEIKDNIIPKGKKQMIKYQDEYGKNFELEVPSTLEDFEELSTEEKIRLTIATAQNMNNIELLRDGFISCLRLIEEHRKSLHSIQEEFKQKEE